jgi:AcrR family transcriptional regulator
VARQPSSTGESVTRAASELMAARGYHGTSMRDVAKAVGIQMASLYYYHASKQELLVHLMRTTLEDLRRSVEEAMEAAGPDPIDQLDAGLRAHIAFHVRRRDDVIITDSELRALEDENRPMILDLRDQYQNLVRGAIERGVERGELEGGRIGIVTTGVMTMCTDVALWYDPNGPLSVDGVADEILRFVMRGLRAG